MNDRLQGLRELQQWMQSHITQLEWTADAISIDEPGQSIEEIILPSKHYDSRQRLEVYQQAYFARLIGCLEEEFPGLKQATGEDAFQAFAASLIHHVPLQSPTLGELGKHFADHLRSTRPPRIGEQPDFADFLIDVASLERVYSEVFDGPGEEQSLPWDPAEMGGMSAADWDDKTLIPSASLKLIELQFPVDVYLAAARGGQAPEFPDPQPIQLAVFRRDYIVRRQRLQGWQFSLLQGLLGKLPLNRVLMDVVESGHDLPNDLLGELSATFRNWGALRIFNGIA